jgi:uncharacterized protein YlxW (UPF0749 family)
MAYDELTAKLVSEAATLRDEIERLTNLHHSGVAYMAEADKALTTLRDEVLEEAAGVADVYGPLSAAAIRALKEAPCSSS